MTAPDHDDDFEPWSHRSPALDALGSLRSHRTDPLRTGFRVSPEKLNGRGLLHGGVIATLADVSIGHALVRISTTGQRYVTVHIGCDLLGTAALGDWIDVTVAPTKTRGRLASGSATFAERDRIVATATALFLPVT